MPYMNNWTCHVCSLFTILGGDVSEEAFERNQQRITEHLQGIHGAQLEVHDGNLISLQKRIMNPVLTRVLEEHTPTEEQTGD